MCMMVYIASDYPLPTSSWDESHPRFHVVELPARDEDQSVRCQFSKPNIYYAGSHEGCGCGFQYGEHQGYEEDASELAAARNSRRQLADFLATALEHQPEVELFACWDGDQKAPLEFRERLRPDDLLSNHTFFREKELMVVYNSATTDR